MPPVKKASKAPKPTGGARPKSATCSPKKKRKKKAKKPSNTQEAQNDDDLEEEEEEETDIVYACPACGLGAGTAVPQGCPWPDPCRGTMYVCKAEDGGGRCGTLCWHSHAIECEDVDDLDSPFTYATTYWCRRCHDECGGSGCRSCRAAGTLEPADQALWEQFGEPAASPEFRNS